DPVVGASHTSNTVWLVHTRDLEVLNGTGTAVCYFYSTDNGTTWLNGSFIGGVNTDNNEQMPSIACKWNDGAPTICYAVVPSDSLMFTWCPNDTNWTVPEKVTDHIHTGNFPPQAGWMTNYSSVLYGGVGPTNLYFDYFGLTGMEDERPVVQKLTALAARPSPALDRAVIDYNLPRAGSARVSVLDIAGREVAVLAHGTLAAGAHSAVWDCANVPAGVYLVRFETGTGSQTGRLVVSH
ncbi:MAG: T9SS type A sorting domain-containing protein, partial [Dehalococcoidales bacterium]|nr:T9SS type A sorting domain-containing protein [Dehalococcoidales bacterium]